MKKTITKKGFSLVELLVAMAIMIVIGGTIFMGINPKKRLRDARDNKRRSDVESILIAIHQHMNENNGALPSAFNGLPRPMPQRGLGTNAFPSGCQSLGYWYPTYNDPCDLPDSACLNLMTGSSNLSKYLSAIPADPYGWTGIFNAGNTGYAVSVDQNDIVTVRACGVEGPTPIVISR